jgi:hypothetical protein
VTDVGAYDDNRGTEVVISRGTEANNTGIVVTKEYTTPKEDDPRTGWTFPAVHNARIVKSTHCRPGDSGSPVYKRTGKNTVMAIGVVFAATKRGRCVYQHVQDIAEEAKSFRVNLG